MPSGENTSTTNYKQTIPCVQCGRQFPGRPRIDGKQKRVCSNECLRDLRGINKICVKCGAKFATYYGYKYCSRDCYNEDHRMELVEINCAHCGKILVRRKCFDLRKEADPNRDRYCDLRCISAAAKKRALPSFNPKRPGYRGPDWKIIRIGVLERANYTCRICHSELPRNGKFTKRGNVDHLIPVRYLSKRGHTWDTMNVEANLSVFCRGCHTRKWHIERILRSDTIDQYAESIKTAFGVEMYDDVRLVRSILKV